METGCEGMRGWSGLVTGAPNKLTSTSACRTSSCSLSIEDLVQISPPPSERKKQFKSAPHKEKKFLSTWSRGNRVKMKYLRKLWELATTWRQWSAGGRILRYDLFVELIFVSIMLLHYSPPEKRWRQPGVPAEIYQQHPTFLLWYINFDNIHGLFEEIPNQLNRRALLPKT